MSLHTLHRRVREVACWRRPRGCQGRPRPRPGAGRPALEVCTRIRSKPALARKVRMSSCSEREKSQRIAPVTFTPAWRSSESARAANAGLRSMAPTRPPPLAPGHEHPAHLGEGPASIREQLKALLAGDVEEGVPERETGPVAASPLDGRIGSGARHPRTAS